MIVHIVERKGLNGSQWVSGGVEAVGTLSLVVHGSHGSLERNDVKCRFLLHHLEDRLGGLEDL